jgi:hypothetical protein
MSTFYTPKEVTLTIAGTELKVTVEDVRNTAWRRTVEGLTAQQVRACVRHAQGIGVVQPSHGPAHRLFRGLRTSSRVHEPVTASATVHERVFVTG